MFNLDKNTTKEFDKTKKIVEVEEEPEVIIPQTKRSLQQENMDDLLQRTLKLKKGTSSEEIMKLSQSVAVTNALLKSVITPETGSQFERDFKSFKNDIQAKFDYLLKTVKTSDVIKKIFKSSLEPDILMDIVNVFTQTLSQISDETQLNDQGYDSRTHSYSIDATLLSS